MTRIIKTPVPDGAVLREYPDGTWQAYLGDDPQIESPRYTRRLKAIRWYERIRPPQRAVAPPERAVPA